MTPRILPNVPVPIVSIGGPRIQLPSPSFAYSSLPLSAAPAVARAPSAIEAVMVDHFSVGAAIELPGPRPKSILPPAKRILKSGKGIELASLDRLFDNKGEKKPEPVAVPGNQLPVPEQIAPSGRPFTLPEHDLEDEIGLPSAIVEAD